MFNKIHLSWLRLTDKISKRRKKIFLWLAGFRNIKKMEITCKHGDYLDTFTMCEDGVIHTITHLKIIIADRV